MERLSSNVMRNFYVMRKTKSNKYLPIGRLTFNYMQLPIKEKYLTLIYFCDKYVSESTVERYEG